MSGANILQLISSGSSEPESVSGLGQLLKSLPTAGDLDDGIRELTGELTAAENYNAGLQNKKLGLQGDINDLEQKLKTEAVEFVAGKDNDALNVYEELTGAHAQLEIFNLGFIPKDVGDVEGRIVALRKDIKSLGYFKQYIQAFNELLQFVHANEVERPTSTLLDQELANHFMYLSQSIGRAEQAKVTVKLCKLRLHKDVHTWNRQGYKRFWGISTEELFK